MVVSPFWLCSAVSAAVDVVTVPLMTRIVTICVCLAGAALIAASGTAHADGPSLKTVLERAGVYVAEFQRQLSGIVAEERYVQEVKPPAAAAARDADRRDLRSDFLLVRAADGQYVGFRDVFEVDGRAIRDRRERLSALFLAPSASARAQITGILSESARYNIGDVERNVNAPTLALMFLLSNNRDRFKFRHPDRPARRQPDTPVPDSPHFAVSTEVWM